MIELYRIFYGLLALMILWVLFEEKPIYTKITFGILALPLILRALHIK